jgi:hypothetical protein
MPTEESKPETPPPGNPAAGGATPDPFDLNALRLSNDLVSGLGVKKALMTVPVRKPDRSWFVRTHPDPNYRFATGMIELKDERGEMYLVAKSLWAELACESTFSARLLITAVNRQGMVFLWPIKLPGPDGRQDEWSRSALEAADRAKNCWVRVQANMSLSAYEVFEATGDLPPPVWTDLPPFQELLKIACRDRFITDWSHPVLRRLRGEV